MARKPVRAMQPAGVPAFKLPATPRQPVRPMPPPGVPTNPLPRPKPVRAIPPGQGPVSPLPGTPDPISVPGPDRILLNRSTMGSPPFTKHELKCGYRKLK